MMAYKFNFIARTTSTLVFELISVLITVLVYLNTKGFAGWALEEFLLLQGTFMFVFSMAHTFFIILPWVVSHNVDRGELDKYMTKPLNLLAYVTMHSFDQDGILPTFGGIAIIVYCLSKLGTQITLLRLLGYFALIIGGLFLLYSLAVIISSVAFVAVKGTGAVAELIFSLADFSKFPLPIFGSAMVFAMTFVLPFGIVAFYPSVVLLNKIFSIWPLIGASLSTCLILILALLFWSKMVKKYQSAGG